MRTTIDLDEDVLGVAKHLAQERAQSIGRVVSDLMRLGLEPRASSTKRGAIPTLLRKPGAKLVTTQMVKELLESET